MVDVKRMLFLRHFSVSVINEGYRFTALESHMVCRDTQNRLRNRIPEWKTVSRTVLHIIPGDVNHQVGSLQIYIRHWMEIVYIILF